MKRRRATENNYIYSWNKHALIRSLISFWARGWYWMHRSIKMSGHCTEGLDQLIHFQTLNWYWPVSSGLTWAAQTHSQVNCPVSLFHSDIRRLTPLCRCVQCDHNPVICLLWAVKQHHMWKKTCITTVKYSALIGLHYSFPCWEFAFKRTVKYLWASLMCFAASPCLVFCCCN